MGISPQGQPLLAMRGHGFDTIFEHARSLAIAVEKPEKVPFADCGSLHAFPGCVLLEGAPY